MAELVKLVREDMNKQLDLIEKSLDRLDDKQVWSRVNDSVNTIGNLCLHLAGNEKQKFVSGIGNQPSERERSEEFSARGGYSKGELLVMLRKVRSESEAVLNMLTDEDLDRKVTIRYSQGDWNRMNRTHTDQEEPSETSTVGRLLLKTATYYAYHTGQIVLLSKTLKETREEHITANFH